MPVPGEPHDDLLLPLYEAARSLLPAGTEWADAHTHIGRNDPDGVTGTADELLAGLDRAGHRRALVFAQHEPGGYQAANDEICDAAAASGGRLAWLGRIDPNAPGAAAEARRCLRAGAHGIKLHPRSDGFGLPHAVVEEVVALVHEAGGIVLFHAGRGIPRLGESAVELARRYRRAHIVLAHAGISDLGWLTEPAAELPNLLFDTAWWQVWDVLHLFAHVPPGRILYASDMPYGSARLHGALALRAGAEVGLGAETLAMMAGGQLERLLAGEPPADLGPAPGAPLTDVRRIPHERAVAYSSAAAQAIFGAGDPDEAIALARLACQSPDGDPVLAATDAFLAAAQEQLAAGGDERWLGAHPVLAAQLVAGTPSVPPAGPA
jgi:uncharacterized protein